VRLEYINSFVDSAQNVMENLVPTGSITRGAITLKDTLSVQDISAMIFLVGGIDGRIALDLERPVAKKIAGLMNNVEFSSVDHVVIDTICELTNIIIGKAVTTLNNKGFRFKPSPPIFYMGEKTYEGLEALCICLSTDWGNIRIQAAIAEKPVVTTKNYGT
jgi:CheY-specific phosphatase CheX